MIRDAVRRFVDDEVRPHIDELEPGDMAPYDILRKLLSTFGMDAMARDRFAKQIERERATADSLARGEQTPKAAARTVGDGGARQCHSSRSSSCVASAQAW